MIYLDNAATTFPKPEYVYFQMDKVNREMAINSGRGSYKLAQSASKMIADTKTQIRKMINVDSTAEVIFAPSITIAINQVLNGLSFVNGDVVYVSPYEHNAVARSLNLIAQEKNLHIKELPINKESLEIDIEQMKYEFIKDKPSLVVCTHISNVTGYILPIDIIFSEAKKYNSITVLDAAQSMGLVTINASQLYADIICFAGHKSLYGPLGIGGFININNIPLSVFLAGGTGSDSLNLNMPNNSESKFEPASCNIVAVAGLNAALAVVNPPEHYAYEKVLTAYLIEQLKLLKNVKMIYEYPAEKQIGIVSFTLNDLNSEEVGTILDSDFDIAVRTGYHCAPYIHKYLKDSDSLGTIRIGIGQYTTIEDIDVLISSLKELEES